MDIGTKWITQGDGSKQCLPEIAIRLPSSRKGRHREGEWGKKDNLFQGILFLPYFRYHLETQTVVGEKDMAKPETSICCERKMCIVLLKLQP